MISIIEEYLDYFLFILPFLTQLGIPVGITLLLILKGSLLDSYLEVFFYILFFSICFIVADILAYGIGNRYGKKLLLHFEYKHSFIQEVHQVLDKISYNPFVMVLLTRTLIFGLAPLVNYAFGIKKFSFNKFILYIFFGEIIFVSIFLLGGYMFSSTLEYLYLVVQDFISLILLIFLFLYLFKHFIFYLQRHFFKRNL